MGQLFECSKQRVVDLIQVEIEPQSENDQWYNSEHEEKLRTAEGAMKLDRHLIRLVVAAAKFYLLL